MRVRWTAIIIAAVAGMVSTGCIAMEAAYLHSTSFVAPAIFTPRPSPDTGPIVVVKVEDRRTGVAGYEVGAKFGWGHEGSTVDLKGKVRLADRLARDMVTILRRQGYRARLFGEVPAESGDVLLTIGIDTFNMLLVLGLNVRLEGLFFMEAVRSSDSHRWSDSVGARFELPTSLYPPDAEFQKLFERLYVTMTA